MSDPVPETLPEALRRQYLGLLGIEQWLPRGHVQDDFADDTVLPVQAPEDSASLPSTRRPVALTPASEAAAITPTSSPTPEQRAALVAHTQMQTREQRAEKISAPAESLLAPAARAAASRPPAERMGCALMRVDDLLLVAAYGQVDAPGMTGTEFEMLTRIAAALRKGHVPAAVIEFSWPPPGIRLPGMDKPGAAREALVAQCLVQVRNGARDMAVLGEELAVLLADAAPAAGFARVAVSPSLVAMQADQEKKAAGWNALKVLQRSAGA